MEQTANLVFDSETKSLGLKIERVWQRFGFQNLEPSHFSWRERLPIIGHREISVVQEFERDRLTRPLSLRISGRMPVLHIDRRPIGEFVVRVHVFHQTPQKLIGIVCVGDQESACALG